jgi:glycosyltransferase involved in cell wall biosynthesis
VNKTRTIPANTQNLWNINCIGPKPVPPGFLMLSVIIPTHDSERALVRTMAALVPGAAAGLVSEVLITDAGSRDQSVAAADHAGCTVVSEQGPLGRRLKAAAERARAPWLLFLRPGAVPEPSWTTEVRLFLEQGSGPTSAAVFRRATPGRRRWGEFARFAVAAIGGKPQPQQGLLIEKKLYQRTGGHRAAAADPEAEYLRRLGRRQIRTLSTAVHHFA